MTNIEPNTQSKSELEFYESLGFIPCDYIKDFAYEQLEGRVLTDGELVLIYENIVEHIGDFLYTEILETIDQKPN